MGSTVNKASKSGLSQGSKSSPQKMADFQESIFLAKPGVVIISTERS